MCLWYHTRHWNMTINEIWGHLIHQMCSCHKLWPRAVDLDLDPPFAHSNGNAAKEATTNDAEGFPLTISCMLHLWAISLCCCCWFIINMYRWWFRRDDECFSPTVGEKQTLWNDLWSSRISPTCKYLQVQLFHVPLCAQVWHEFVSKDICRTVAHNCMYSGSIAHSWFDTSFHFSATHSTPSQHVYPSIACINSWLMNTPD